VAQVGRISGPLLVANLERNGIDLAFRNTLDHTQLLYLDVNNGLIGINKDSPGYNLDVASTARTNNLIVDTSANIADFSVDTNNINNLTGDIYLNSTNAIQLSNFATDDIKITDNIISSRTSNSSIDLFTNGTGTLEVLANLNVDGNIHATGDISMDGNIEFGDAGDDSTQLVDTIVLDADVNSNIIPAENQTYDLGSSSRRWSELYTVLVNGNSLVSAELDLDGVRPFTIPQGNIIYVSQNGDDSNRGDHPQGPFKTIKRALDFADGSTGGPVTIYVYAGGYEEETPLVVPSNVTIIGEDYRNTIVRPESAYQSEDIFHLNGESTVQNLTITDFYYDSGNDTGYAFRFAPNTTVTTRSPYIQNVTVITKGTTTSASDPRGFASGDAGKGALIDGADVLSSSEEASMLFHSCTFITPGVDALTMTNGVRVEWLNSFTYFASRGLYAVDGATGHLSTDGSTVKYGAELRSIGSANVYGNFGAVADGSDCLMYLIQHNMAYIGVGRFVDNDPSRVIQSQEVTELNSGKIYFQTIDHFGNFRVGDSFLIDQETGETSLVLTEAEIDALNGLTVTTNDNTTFIDGTRVETGNIRFRDNTISSLSGDINISSASSTINLQNSTNIQKDLSISGNLSFDGSLITIGNDPTDTIDFNTEFTQDIIPDISGLYDLGSPSKTWLKSWLNQSQISDIKIQDNFITTSVSNADLELRANSNAKINISENNVYIANNLNVDGTTTLDYTIVNGTINHYGDYYQTGDTTVTGNVAVSQDLEVSAAAQFEEILFNGNLITTTTSNQILELRANGTGDIKFLADVNVVNNLYNQNIDSADIDVATNIQSVELIASNNIQIRDNFIQTTQSNSDLELRSLYESDDSTGAAKIITSNPVEINNNLNVNGNLTFSANLTADDLLGVTDVISDQFYAERLHTDNQIEIWDNNISTVVSNSDLELKANASGRVILENFVLNENTLSTELEDSTDIDINLTANNITMTSTASLKIPIGTTVDRIGNKGDIRFNTDYGLFEGLGSVYVGFGGIFSEDKLSSVTVDKFANNIRMIVNGDNDNIDSTTLFAGVNETELFAKRIDIDDISIDSNTIRTSVSNSDLELRTSGTGELVVDNISIKDNTFNNNFEYDGSTISTALTLASTDNGRIKFSGTAGIVVPVGGDADRPISDPPIGDTRFNTDSQILETWDGEQYVISAGVAAAITPQEFDDLLLEYTLALG